MGATKEDTEDFHFIFNEMERMSALLQDSHEKYYADFDNITACINTPRDIYKKSKDDNYFQLHLSSEAQNKLSKISSRQIKSNKHQNILSSEEFIQDIKDSIYIHVKDKLECTQSNYNKLLSRAFKRAKSKMSQQEYFFPLQANGINENTEINIGTVKIISKELIVKSLKDEEMKKLFINPETDNYNALVCIKVPKSSNKTSYIKAVNVANLIYGFIHLIGTYTRIEINAELKSNPTEDNINHYFSKVENNDLEICGSINLNHNPDKLWSHIAEEFDQESDLGMIFSKLVENSISPTAPNNLADRLIDAIYWFGDAKRDNNKHSQVVKLVNALERLVTLSIEKNDQNVTKNFNTRVACLISIYNGEIDYWKKQASELYNFRSDLVHGNYAVYKSYNLPISTCPFRLACYTILSSCIAFYKVGLESTNHEKKLKSMYEDIEKHCSDIKYHEKKDNI